MKIQYRYLSCVLLVLTGHQLTAEPLSRYRYNRAVDGTFVQQEVIAAELDAQIWKTIGVNDIDIRIADQEGRIIPHMMRRAGSRETRMVRHPRASRIETLTDREANQLELQVALDKQAAGANVLFFDTPLKDFEKAVTIWGATTNGTETLLVEQARIFDYSRFADVRNTYIDLPENSTQYRLFRILVEDVMDEATLPVRWETRQYQGNEETLREEHTRVLTRPFRINAVRMYERKLEDTGSTPRITVQTFSTVTLQQKQDPAVTIVEVEHNGSPLTAIVLACDDANFSRRASVEIPVRRDGRETWREIAAGKVSRISFRDVKQETLQLDVPETRSLRYRLTLFDHDNPPLQDVSLKGKGPIWQAVFLADADKTYTLFYGPEDTPQPPRYDLTPLERVLRQDHEPMVRSLQPETANPLFQKAGLLAGENAMRALFGLAIIVMLIVLSTGLYRAARHIT